MSHHTERLSEEKSGLWKEVTHMTSLSEKALEILQADTENTEFSNSDLIAKGFSDASAKIAIKELEENGYIVIIREYVTGNVVFELV